MRNFARRRLEIVSIAALVLMLAGCSSSHTFRSADQLPVACLDKPDRGPCRASQVRFYYDYRDDRCKAFTYGGCRGRVPFQTLQSCLDFCGAAR